MGLSHIVYCDKIEIDTVTNNTVATMNSSKDRVIVKKIKWKKKYPLKLQLKKEITLLK